MRSTYRYRSFFWPAVLILVGVIALLANTGQIPAERLFNLVLLWPLVLVVIGLELIVRRAMHGVAGDVAAALIVLLAIAGAAAYVAAAPNPSATASMDSKADLGSISRGTLEIDAGAAEITVTGTTDIGSSLYQAHIDYSGPKPEVTLDRSTGNLRIDQPNNTFFAFQSRRFVLDLRLNPSIPWSITQNTGASTDTYHLQGVQLDRMTLNTGASRDDITLGPTSNSVPIEINGGALTVNVHRPSSVLASVEVSGGAVSLNVDGHVQHAVGNVRYEPGNSTGGPSYSIRVNGGACTVTLDTSGSV
ncbi:MAG TPA: DUF5668 domain-containing protein [Candidatus Dormibacteraeota bacterium]|nr:DUF5668 domain-containing protein [Candidatus Dormibacteraeota bacterium]